MPMIVSICRHCDEQQFCITVMCSCGPYTTFSVANFDLSIRALLLDHILALKKNAYASQERVFTESFLEHATHPVYLYHCLYYKI